MSERNRGRSALARRGGKPEFKPRLAIPAHRNIPSERSAAQWRHWIVGVDAVGRRWVARLSAAVGAGVLLVACGDGRSADDSMVAEDPAQQGADELPSDFEVGSVLASDSAGWVIGRPADAADAPAQLWRLGVGGSASKAADLAWPGAPPGAGVGDGVALAGIRCDGDGPRQPEDPCDHATALVYFYGADGTEADPVVLWEDDDPVVNSAGLGGGLSVVGATGDAVWVRGHGRVFEVTAAEGVVREVEPSGGLDCPVSGDLYTLVADAGGSPASGDGVDTGDPRREDFSPEEGAESRTLHVETYAGEAWAPVDGRSQTFTGDLEARCRGDRIEITRMASAEGLSTAPPEALVGVWTLDDGWRSVSARSAAIPGGIVAVSETGEDMHAVVQLTSGELRHRSAQGSYDPSGLSLPVLGEAGEIPPVLVADATASVLAACTYWAPAGEPSAAQPPEHETNLSCAAGQR